MFMVSYGRRRDFLIDGLYSPSHGTPCLFEQTSWTHVGSHWPSSRSR